jgi:hypothetical protein
MFGLWDLLKLFGIFLVFGYFEKLYSLGCLVSLCLGLYTLMNRRMKSVMLLAVVQCLLDLWLQHKQLSYVVFCVLDCLFVSFAARNLSALLVSDDGSSDMHITFRPYEKVQMAVMSHWFSPPR